jgi:bacterioferritin-associated ferredoxin
LDCSKITEKTVKSIIDKGLTDADDIKEEFEVMRDMERPENSEQMIQEVRIQIWFYFLLYFDCVGASNAPKCSS